MLKSEPSRVSALVVGRREITLALGESRRGSADPIWQTFTFPENLSWDAPDALGDAFAVFLREQGIKLRRVGLIGLPANYLAIRTLRTPPVDSPELLPGLVELAVEEHFAERKDDLAYSYMASSDEGEQNITLIVASQEQIKNIEIFLQHAGLHAECITSLATGIFCGLSHNEAHSALLIEYGEQVEIALFDHGRLTALQALPPSPVDEEAYRRELKRITLTMSNRLDGVSVYVLGSPELTRAAETVFSSSVTPLAKDETPDEVKNTAALMLAFGVRISPTPPPNLIERRRRFKGAQWNKYRRKILIAASVFVLLLGLFVWDWINQRQAAASARNELDVMRPQTQTLEEYKTLTQTTDAWFPKDLRYLDAMLTLTNLFPDDSNVWLTGVTIKEDGELILTGKARNRSLALELLSLLQKNDQITDILSHYIQQSGQGQGVVTFSISCRYVQKGTQ